MNEAHATAGTHQHAEHPHIATEHPVSNPKEGSILYRLRCEIERLSPGDKAALRRNHESASPPLAFYRLGALIGEDFGHRETAWRLVMQCLAMLEGVHSSTQSLGRALAEHQYSELRLLRLLRADPDGIGAHIRTLCAFLSSKGARSNVEEIAWLILLDEGEKRDRALHRIASDYFRNLPR